MQLADPFGGWPPGRAAESNDEENFKDLAQPYGLNLMRTRARRNLVELYLHPAPRCENHIGVALDDGLPGDHSILRLPASAAKLGENGLAAGNLDQLIHPLNAADNGVIPLFSKKTARLQWKMSWPMPRCVRDRGSRSESVHRLLPSSSQDPRDHAAIVSKISAMLR